jgi:TonB family protein
VAHAVSTSSFRSDHMSPSAVALAVLLHGLVVLAVWWMSLHPTQPPAEESIDITFEQPKPEPPPPPLQPKVQPPQPAPPVELGLRPPAPLVSDKPTQVPPSGERPNDPPAPPPPPLQDALPQPEPQAPPPTPSELAKPAPPLPAPQEHPSGPQHALAAPRHALPAPQPARPQPHPQPQLERPELRPSPLTTAPPRRPPAGRPGDDPSPSPFVNPADTYNRARVADNYLWQVVRKLIGYRYEAHVTARQGLTVVRVVIARDGRLLDVEVAQSSGYPEFDRGVIAGVRAGSPYTPLPPEIHGDSATFNLPLVSVNRQ